MLYFSIAILASIIGAISGIGGGIIIKPVMDCFTDLTPSAISFMSGCTVLSMACSSYIRGLKDKVKLNYDTTLWLALGACAGGWLGKTVFAIIAANATANVKLIQSVLLLIINLLVFLYLVKKAGITTKHIKNKLVCVIIGFILGVSSSFLGIGGGPINIVVLSFFFSTQAKETAKNSLFIILFSQLTSFITTLATHTVPDVNFFYLAIMCLGGISGAIIGSSIAKKMDNTKTEKFFRNLLIALIVLNIYNIYAAL